MQGSNLLAPRGWIACASISGSGTWQRSDSSRRLGRTRASAWSLATRVARLLGIDIARRNYSSPIPDLDRLDPRLWIGPHALPGVAFDLERQFRLLEGELAPLVAEFDAELAGG